MASKKAVKVIAKFNALHLAATQLECQCSPMQTFGDIEDVDHELISEIEKEVASIVSSLRNRAEKLNLKYTVELPNLVTESQFKQSDNEST